MLSPLFAKIIIDNSVYVIKFVDKRKVDSLCFNTVFALPLNHGSQ